MENNIPPRRPPMPPSDFQPIENDEGGNGKRKKVKARKERFELNSQTKTFIILFTGIICLAGAIFCFVKLFI